ncbi:MAG: hypothetical protein WCI05_15525, partial [Myxococcales bacterium]
MKENDAPHQVVIVFQRVPAQVHLVLRAAAVERCRKARRSRSPCLANTWLSWSRRSLLADVAEALRVIRSLLADVAEALRVTRSLLADV